MSNKKYQRSLVAFCFVFLLAIFTIPINCQNSRDDSGLSVPIYDDGCKYLMKAMHQEWSKADGELDIVFCKKMIWAVLLDPNAFYREFSADSVQYERFLNCIMYNAFRNYNDTTTSQLEKLRLVAIGRLQEQTYSIDSNYIRFHEELIDKIRHVIPDFVD
ncbi:MAG: hypothetical protein R3F48_00485 [Candidatus Zixiibacteriota bacterium]